MILINEIKWKKFIIFSKNEFVIKKLVKKDKKI